MEDKQRREEIALFRYQIIAEVLAEPSGGARQRLMAEIARSQHDIPYSNRTLIGKRTLERWVKAYQHHGLQGLEPVPRSDAGQGYAITPEVLAAAAALRREKPACSIRQIIETLEMAGTVPRGVLKRSTLAEALTRIGCTRQALTRKSVTYRRFQEEHRNRAWQGDCQHTLVLPHPTLPGRSRKVYLLAWLDDYSRNVWAQFYFEEKGPRLEDCLKRAILRYGIPQKIYVDLCRPWDYADGRSWMLCQQDSYGGQRHGGWHNSIRCRSLPLRSVPLQRGRKRICRKFGRAGVKVRWHLTERDSAPNWQG